MHEIFLHKIRNHNSIVFTLLILISTFCLLTTCSQKKESVDKSSTIQTHSETLMEEASESTTAVDAEADQVDKTVEQTASQVQSTISNDIPGKSDSSDKDSKPDVYKAELEDQIVKKYYSEAAALRDSTAAKVGVLIKQALKELEEDKDSKDDSEFYSKYMNSALVIQQECDSKFNDIIERMKEELLENNLPLGAVDKARKQYESEKKEQINRLE